jgi:phosphatidylglycerol:prolipoprotein diacylglycerol transferase
VHPVLVHIGAFVIPSYGAVVAVGVLLALMLALHVARKLHVDPNLIWNLSILMLFIAIVGSRLLLVIVNWTVLRHHPVWMLSLAMFHHPLLAGIGVAIALVVAAIYAGLHRLPFRRAADVLAPSVALGLGFEQIAALLSGSGYGTGTHAPWAVVYTDPLAARWANAPLGIPVHPVQAYAALGFFAIAAGLMLGLPRRRQHGDIIGLFLISTGVVMYITEFWRDPIGRGAILQGFLKGPQVAGVIFVIIGAIVLLERQSQLIAHPLPHSRPASSTISEQPDA